MTRPPTVDDYRTLELGYGGDTFTVEARHGTNPDHWYIQQDANFDSVADLRKHYKLAALIFVNGYEVHSVEDNKILWTRGHPSDDGEESVIL